MNTNLSKRLFDITSNTFKFIYNTSSSFSQCSTFFKKSSEDIINQIKSINFFKNNIHKETIFMKEDFPNNPQYKKLIKNSTSSKIYKNVYLIKKDSFIFNWYKNNRNLYSNENKKTLDRQMLSPQNNMFNYFFKKYGFGENLFSIDPSVINNFDVNRFNFLYSVKSFDNNITPHMYSNNTGTMCISLPETKIKEQIIENISNFVEIEHCKYFITSPYGNFGKTISGNCFFNIDRIIPNYVSNLLEYILKKDFYMDDLEKAKLNVYKKSNDLDLFKKSYDGSKMSIPTKLGWNELNISDLNSYNISDINTEILFNDYESQLILPVLRTVWG